MLDQLKQPLEQLLAVNRELVQVKDEITQLQSTIDFIENSKAYRLKKVITIVTKKLKVYYHLLVFKFRVKYNFISLVQTQLKSLSFRSICKNVLFFFRSTLLFLKLFLRKREFLTLYLSYFFANLSPIQVKVTSPSKAKPVAKVDIIIPWYGDPNIVQLILLLKLQDEKFIDQVFLIDDTYPDQIRKNKVFNQIGLINYHKLKIIHNKTNLGFVGTVNKGMKLSKNDVVLLNSDTKPTTSWLQHLRAACYSAKNIATATAVSNNATIFSLQRFNQPTHDPKPEITAQKLAALSPTEAVSVPTAHGFCMYIRRSILKRFGYFDRRTYSSGYCEENDFSMKTSQAGFKHVAAAKSYVIHLEARSFGDKRKNLQIKKNYQKLVKRYPQYNELIDECLKTSEIKNLQHFLALMMKQNYSAESSLLCINHSNIFSAVGGVERTTFNQLVQLQGKAKNILVFFFDDENKVYKLFIISRNSIQKILVFDQATSDKQILQWILQAFIIKQVIINHLMHHAAAYLKTFQKANITTTLFVHDYYYLFDTPDLLETGSFTQPGNQVYRLNQKAKLQKKNLLNKVNHLIFNSEFTKEIYEKHLGPMDNAYISYPDLMLSK